MGYKKKLQHIRQQLAENAAAGVDNDKGIDEDLFRECVVLEIQLACKGALEGLDLIEQELPLVERQEQLKKLEDAKTGRWKEQEAVPAPQPANKPITVDLPPGYVQSTGPMGGITITRSTLADQVFRPGFNMATVSIEEAGERDYQEMMQRQAREAASAAQRAAEPDEDNVLHYDTVTVYKDRDWDAFVDDNPKGAGNSMANLG